MFFEYAKLRDFNEGEFVFDHIEFETLRQHVEKLEFDKARALAKRFGAAFTTYPDVAVNADCEYTCYGNVYALVKPRDGNLLGIIVYSESEDEL